MRLVNIHLVLIFFLTSQLAFADNSGLSQKLVTAFWQADTDDARALARQNLQDATNDVGTLYSWLREGPRYSSDVSLGLQKGRRKGSDGTHFPFVFIVPESYDPEKKYPLEFYLHGGISSPKSKSLVRWKKNHFNAKRFEKLDQITVLPLAWNRAIWWQDSQAENLSGILRKIKKTYNIDDDRVYLSGVSDGGTGVYFYAFKQASEWAAFLPFIGSAAVLTNPKAGGGFPLNFENLTNAALYIVNGEKDRLYPITGIMPLINTLEKQNTNYSFTEIKDGGHNLNWLSAEIPKIMQFKQDNPRNTSPATLRWVTDRVDRYNRIYWMRIDGIKENKGSGWMAASRTGNTFSVFTDGVTDFSLLLNPDAIDFSQPVTVVVNKKIRFNNKIQQDSNVLLDWAKNLDKAQLYTAELKLNMHF